MTTYASPALKVVVAGSPYTKEYKIADATNMYPRRIVKRGSADGLIVVGTAGCTPLGVLGYENTMVNERPKDANGNPSITSIYLINKKAAVHNGPMIVTLTLLTDVVVEGDALVAGADGKVRKAAAMTATVPGDSTPVLSTSAQPAMTMAGSLPAGGPIVAYAEEGQDASGGDKTIVARWVL